MNWKRVVCIATASLASLSSLPASAQGGVAYPSKPVRWVVPYPPGGFTDVLARMLGAKLSESFGQPVVVENRVGASGAIGTEFVAKSTPDGHTIVLAAAQTHGINPVLDPKLPYHPTRDFTPISLLVTVPHVLVVSPGVPANTLEEFVRLAKSRPGMAFASSGNASPAHLAIEMLKGMARIDLVHIPYKGVAPALNDLVGGQVQLMSVDTTSGSAHIKAGRIRPIAIATAQRVPGIDLPTVAESGYPGFEVTAWYAVFGPAGIPSPVLAKLHGEVVKALTAPDVRERLQGMGATVVGSSPAALGSHVEGELARWGKVIKEAKITAD